jgi:hypothetical protein
VSASRQEVQELVEQLFALLGLRMTRAGQIVLHFSDGGVYQRCECNVVIKPGPDRPMRKAS